MQRRKMNSENLLSPNNFPCRIVVKFQIDPQLLFTDATEINSFFSQDYIIPWSKLCKGYPRIRINRLFTSTKPHVINQLVNKAIMQDRGYHSPNFFTYYIIDCPSEINAGHLLQSLLICENIELAYIVNNSKPPHSGNATGEFANLSQGYLNPAPEGINSKYAWEIKGGDGEGNVKFIDIEQGWVLNHENIKVNTLSCTGLNYAYKDHGAAVLGIIMMQKKKNGGRGITPKVQGYVISQWRLDGCLNNADAIMAALECLEFGDIILIEAQVRDSATTKNLWPVEIHDATFHAIRLASALGITVIEAAGNGGVDFSLGKNLDRFSINGKKILNRFSPDFLDSGAIIVGAASSTMPHTRIHNSNYGNRIDCYAWGQRVATTGRFSLSSGEAIDTYTTNFGGTSSAAAIIAGATISVQSIVEANYNFRFGPADMRTILSNDLYGTQSANGHSVDKIGVMPDLKKIIDNVPIVISGGSIRDCQVTV